MARLQLSALCKDFGPQAPIVKGIDLQIEDGEFMVLVGPSGCGKSTTLRMIAGLEEVSSGEIRIGARLVNDVPPAERSVAMVFQSYALYPHMSVADNLGFALKVGGQSRQQIDAAVDSASSILQLGSLLARKPRELSGGQRQRVAIGRAIVRQPEVFLFDEPLSNLDASLRAQMRIELSRLHERLGATMVYVTHDQVEAMTLGDRIAIFNAGRIEQVGTPMALYQRPANRFVAEFLGSPRMNFVAVEAHREADGSLWVTAGEAGALRLPANAALDPGTVASLGLRPEHLVLGPPDEPGGLLGQVAFIEQLGDVALVHCRLPDQPDDIIVKCDAESGADHRLTRHAPVRLYVEGRHMLLFDAQGAALYW